MLAKLANIDLILIIAYFIIVLLIGWRTSRKEDNQGFLVGNRQIGTAGLNATVSASLTGGSAIAAYIALLYLWGFSAFWIFIGACVGLLVFIPFAAKIKKEGDAQGYLTMLCCLFSSALLFWGLVRRYLKDKNFPTNFCLYF